jgi:formate hydrogenlyase subunit 3/multisubunit Na+/H+ antiporter MnhD subunit
MVLNLEVTLQTPLPPTVSDNVPLQICSLVLAMVSLILIGVIIRKDRKIAWWFVAPILGLLHGIWFYITIFLDKYTDIAITPLFGSYTVWSSALRFQTYFTIVAMLITFLVLQIITKRRYGPK